MGRAQAQRTSKPKVAMKKLAKQLLTVDGAHGATSPSVTLNAAVVSRLDGEYATTLSQQMVENIALVKRRRQRRATKRNAPTAAAAAAAHHRTIPVRRSVPFGSTGATCASAIAGNLPSATTRTNVKLMKRRIRSASTSTFHQ